jgi:hypothetical protein
VPYRLAPIFLIRLAGAPFETIENLATRETSAAARELLVRQGEFAEAKSDVEELLNSRRHNLSKERFQAWRKTIRSGAPPPCDPPLGVFAVCSESASKLATAEMRFDQSLRRELEFARQALHQAARTILPDYLVFAAEGLHQRLTNQFSSTEIVPPRNKQARAHERTMILYLQRVCAKNDSLSAFGPGGWGMIDNVEAAILCAPDPGIAKRETFLERWTADAIAAALNADPDVRAELSPRLNPNGRIDSDRFVFMETGEIIPLKAQTLELLSGCDGKTPAHSLGDHAASLLEQLAERHIIRWEVEVPALDPYAFETLIADILRWRETPLRARWLELLQPIADLPRKFAHTDATKSRAGIMEEANARLSQLGAARQSTRFLYAATNPIGEECLRECNFLIDEKLIDQVAIEAAPWIDLWRDCYAFIASRVAAGLRGVFEQMSIKSGAAPLPAFLRACETANLPLTGPGLVALSHIAFQEVKAAFHKMMEPHASKAEYELAADDCHFVRRNFQYEKFDEYTYPSADMQLAAKSAEAVARGDYHWILAELHPPVALLHHGFYWSCPDKTTLHCAMASTVFGRPNFHFGFFAADFTATTTVRFFDALPEWTYFVAPQRGNPNWRTVRPADAEVYVNPNGGDVCVRKIGSKEHLGSFARAWIIPLGFHPFQFGMAAPHMPRLRCGKVIVQRRAWTITHDELGAGNYTGVSRDLVLAIERLRAQKNWPRFVYIRPTEQALRRSGAEGRDKDTKPVFVDLESYLFLEIFHRWLTKSGELEVTEMLPDPDHLLWKEPDGRRTFELRTLIIPRS